MILNQVLNRMTIQVLFSLSSALFTETLRHPGNVFLFLAYVSVHQWGRLIKCVFQTNVNATNTLAMKHLESILPYLWMRFPGPYNCIHVYASPQNINLWPCDGALRSDRAILIVRSCVCVRGRIYIYIFINFTFCLFILLKFQNQLI